MNMRKYAVVLSIGGSAAVAMAGGCRSSSHARTSACPTAGNPPAGVTVRAGHQRSPAHPAPARCASLGVYGVDTSIPPQNQVILTGAWTPTQEQTGKALKSIQACFESPEGVHYWGRIRVKMIEAKGPAYRVQFVGEQTDGRKFIYCNFFPADGDFPHWKEKEVQARDGGSSFWQTWYDIQKDECERFSMNGAPDNAYFLLY